MNYKNMVYELLLNDDVIECVNVNKVCDMLGLGEVELWEILENEDDIRDIYNWENIWYNLNIGEA